MATREEIEAAAADRFVASEDGRVLLGWMRRVSRLDETIVDPSASDAELRHYAGRQWLVNSIINLARKA